MPAAGSQNQDSPSGIPDGVPTQVAGDFGQGRVVRGGESDQAAMSFTSLDSQNLSNYPFTAARTPTIGEGADKGRYGGGRLPANSEEC